MKRMLILAFILLLAIRLYPAVTNEFPKGTDSWYHIDKSMDIIKGEFSSYPPVFHIMLAGIFWLMDFGTILFVSKFIGVFLNLLSCFLLYLLVKDIYSEKAALASVLVYGLSLEIVNTAMYLAPANLGLVLIPAIILLLRKKQLILPAFLAVALALTHPLSFFVLVAICMAMTKKYVSLFKVILSGALALIIFSSLTGNTLIPTEPSTMEFFFGQFSVFFFLLCIYGLLTEKNHKMALLMAVMLTFIFFSPFYGTRMLTFFIIPASVMAGAGFSKLGKYRYIFPVIMIISIFPLLNFGYAKAEMTGSDYEMMLWIKQNIGNETIASSWQVSSPWIEAVADKKTVLGAFQESVPDYKERREALKKLFNGDFAAVEKYNAKYVFVNRMEEPSYPGVIERFSGLELVKTNGYAYLFKLYQ